MSLKFEVKKYKAKEELELKDLEGKSHKIPILLTYEEADELVAINKDPDKSLDFDRFAEMLFKDNLEKVKTITGSNFEDCVVEVGFQFMGKLFSNRMERINYINTMRQKINKN